MSHWSDTRAKLRQVQELLGVLLDDANEMLADDADAGRWLGPVVTKILENLQQQFALEEAGGYLTNVLEQYPQWHPQVVHLLQEHRLLQRQLHDIRERIRCDAERGGVSRACRRQLRDWITWYREHQHRENALVQEAFVFEAGQGE